MLRCFFKLDIEMWHAVRKQKKQGELLVAVAEDQTLKKNPMELIRQCLADQSMLKITLNIRFLRNEVSVHY